MFVFSNGFFFYYCYLFFVIVYSRFQQPCRTRWELAFLFGKRKRVICADLNAIGRSRISLNVCGQKGWQCCDYGDGGCGWCHLAKKQQKRLTLSSSRIISAMPGLISMSSTGSGGGTVGGNGKGRLGGSAARCGGAE